MYERYINFLREWQEAVTEDNLVSQKALYVCSSEQVPNPELNFQSETLP